MKIVQKILRDFNSLARQIRKNDSGKSPEIDRAMAEIWETRADWIQANSHKLDVSFSQRQFGTSEDF